MKLKKPVSGKILQHDRGMGVPTEGSVERRAEELALIAGREEPNESDLHQAWRELHGGRHPEPVADEEMIATSSPHEAVSPSLGHQSDNLLFGQTSMGEELVAEGLDEAEHDRMLAAREEIDLPDQQEED